MNATVAWDVIVAGPAESARAIFSEVGSFAAAGNVKKPTKAQAFIKRRCE